MRARRRHIHSRAQVQGFLTGRATPRRGLAVKRHDWAWLRDQFRFRWSKETLDVFQDNEERFQLDSARGFTLDLTARLALRDERPLDIESFVLGVLSPRAPPTLCSTLRLRQVLGC
jgi:hypothetical protein